MVGVMRQVGNSQRADGRFTARQRAEVGEWSEQQLAGLARALEQEVIPRLVLAQRNACPPGRVAGSSPGLGDVTALVERLLHGAAGEADALVEEMREHGVSVETLYLDLFAPAAHRLGDLWLADECDFAEVTLGLYRLQQQLHAVSRAFQCECEQHALDRRVMLAPTPGERHLFGTLLIAEFFYRAGWCVHSEFPSSNEHLAALVDDDWFDVVGLSLSCALACEDRLAALASSVHAVRRASRNRRIGVFVDGRIFATRPELAASVGADAAAVDARHALLQADSMLALLPGRFRDGAEIR